MLLSRRSFYATWKETYKKKEHKKSCNPWHRGRLRRFRSMRKYNEQCIGHWKRLPPVNNCNTPHEGHWRKIACVNKFNARCISPWKRCVDKRSCNTSKKGKPKNTYMRRWSALHELDRQTNTEDQVSNFLHCHLRLLSDLDVAQNLMHMLETYMGEEGTERVILAPPTRKGSMLG